MGCLTNGVVGPIGCQINGGVGISGLPRPKTHVVSVIVYYDNEMMTTRVIISSCSLSLNFKSITIFVFLNVNLSSQFNINLNRNIWLSVYERG